MKIAPELVGRFRADLAPLWPFLDDDGARLGLAVSGGSDSLALLLLAHAALPRHVEAATVDHQLRPGSAAEAELVASFCHELSVPHRTITVEVAPGNLQDRARAARYAALGAWCEDRGLCGLATAHQLDDQAETFLMRLNRGSGLSGLVSIRALGSVPDAGVRLVRPLLRWARAELADLVHGVGWDAVRDPSNENTDFDRIRMRKALAKADWLDRLGLERSARLLAEADETLQWVIGREFNECVTRDSEEAVYAALRTGVIGTLVKAGVIRSIFRGFGVDIDQRAAVGMAEALARGEKSNVAGIQACPYDRLGERLWIFSRENPRRTG